MAKFTIVIEDTESGSVTAQCTGPHDQETNAWLFAMSCFLGLVKALKTWTPKDGKTIH
jgi:hypothetical protein